VLRRERPGVHTICGLSNISYGLPGRRRLNRTFLVMAMARGLDSAILDVLDAELMALVKTVQALNGDDPYCMKYIKAYRAGELQVGRRKREE